MTTSAAGSQQDEGSPKPLAPWIEPASVVILSLATLTSGWSAYQASLWDGEQTFALALSAAAGREAARLSVQASQRRTVDGEMFVVYLATLRRDPKAAEFLLQRFRPVAKEALKAWLATHPLENPRAPASPFMMPSYSVAEDQGEQQAAKQSDEEFDKANRANGISDRYVLLTVLFSITMFLAGIGPVFKDSRIRTSLVALGGLFLVVSLAILCRYPVATPSETGGGSRGDTVRALPVSPLLLP